MNGVLYVAFGRSKRRERELFLSRKSLARHSPRLPVAIVSDRNRKGKFLRIPLKPEEITSDVWETRLNGLMKTPFEKTLMVGCDTLFGDDVTPLFDLLDTWDVAAAPCTVTREERIGAMMFNCDVVLWSARSLIADWREEYLKRNGLDNTDQESFFRIIHRYRFCCLNNRWNMRPNVPQAIRGTVGILHSHAMKAEAILESLNSRNVQLMHHFPRKRIVANDTHVCIRQ